MKMSDVRLIVGIDLGTTNSECFVYSTTTNTPELQYLNGSLTGMYPSVILYDQKAEKFIVGQEAKDNEGAKVWREMKIDLGKGEAKKVTIGSQTLNPITFSTIILKYIYEGLQQAYNDPIIETLVITVPADFKDAERQATLKAAHDAGFEPENEIRLINEPTAAALAYGEKLNEAQTLVSFDLGGGTFDVTFLEYDNIDGVRFYQALKTDGLILGGRDFDRKIIDYLYEGYLATDEGKAYKKDVAFKESFYLSAKNLAERIKINLSKTESVSGTDIIKVNGNRIILEYSITRDQFEKMIEGLVDRTIQMTKKVIGEEEVGCILMVGGSTRVPLIKKKIEEAFPNIPRVDDNPDLIVALGACIQASIISNKKESFLNEILTNPLGISVSGDFVKHMLYEGTPIPYEIEERFYRADDGDEVSAFLVQGKDILLESRNNQILGEIVLTGMKNTEAGAPVDIKIRVDNSGMVEVTASEVEEDGAKFFNNFKIGSTMRVQAQNYADLRAQAFEKYKDKTLQDLTAIADEIIEKIEAREEKVPSDHWLLEKLQSGRYGNLEEFKVIVYRADLKTDLY